MIVRTDEPYVMLMASLPALGPLLGSQTPAIGEARLRNRLELLSPADREMLEAMRAALAWSHLDLGETDEAFLRRIESLTARIRSPSLRDALRDRLELRTIIAALRRRAAGQRAPAAGELWGYGRFVDSVRANWDQPDFGVARAFPWIKAARSRLEAGDAVGLERIVLQAAWDAVLRHAEGHIFDFEAVAFYVVRWSLADRWSRYDVAAATLRFEEMLDAATVDIPAAIETTS